MNKPLFCLAIVTLLVGCRQRENLAKLKAISQTLQTANDIIRQNNLSIIYEFENRARDMQTGTYVVVWKPKATRIKEEAESIIVHIEQLRKELLKQSDSFKKAKAPFIEQLYAANGPGYKLVTRLAAFKDSFPAIVLADGVDSSYRQAYTSKLDTIVPLLRGYSNSLNDAQKRRYAKRWLEENFAGTTAGMAYVILNKVENDLLTTTKTFMDFCLHQTAVLHYGNPSSFSALAILSSSYVKQGQAIEVIAGLGQFSTVLKPRISMNGKEIKLDDHARAVHRFTANGNPGKHSVVVKIHFQTPDGTIEHVSKKLEYIIADMK